MASRLPNFIAAVEGNNMRNFLLIKNNQAAHAYMDNVSQESQFTSHHKGFTKVPHKIHRCYGLTQYEKLILIDVIAYMSDKSQCGSATLSWTEKIRACRINLSKVFDLIN